MSALSAVLLSPPPCAAASAVESAQNPNHRERPKTALYGPRGRSGQSAIVRYVNLFILPGAPPGPRRPGRPVVGVVRPSRPGDHHGTVPKLRPVVVELRRKPGGFVRQACATARGGFRGYAKSTSLPARTPYSALSAARWFPRSRRTAHAGPPRHPPCRCRSAPQCAPCWQSETRIDRSRRPARQAAAPPCPPHA